jgi:four helix bundle protein
MATSLEDLKVLGLAEGIADSIWAQVVRWDEFVRDTVGKQVVRAADSIGANIAEGFGRFNFGEKLQFLYYARGSLFETKYWLNRTLARNLMSSADVESFVTQLTALARQLNAFAKSIKSQRHGDQQPRTLKEVSPEYATWAQDNAAPLFAAEDLDWLQATSNP